MSARSSRCKIDRERYTNKLATDNIVLVNDSLNPFLVIGDCLVDP